MRVYALLLGLVLTGGSGYAAQVAVSSLGAGGAMTVPVRSNAPSGAHDVIWYGGVLDPITVEAKGDAPAKTQAARRRLFLDRSSVSCSKASRAHRALLL
jgi:hypothetical protein